VLLEGRTARAWRLDAAVANTAESLSVYCDVLGVPLERSWQAGREPVDKGLRFIDLPGVDWRDRAAIGLLGEQLRRYLVPHVHLVLNGAYEVNLLLAQARAFESLPVEDLIITHLDEEPRWGKLWNLVLGTNYSVRFLSAGQNIPGEFLTASADALLARQFPS
jgi:flagellar biosynthesis GTPase FlhF